MKKFFIIISILFFAASHSFAQTTEFTYQGRLINGSLPANGNFDFEFTLYDAETGGTILGTIPQNNVTVTNGTFSVRLDFGANFPGDNRFLEIKVKQSTDPTFTTLNPRQKITSSPYSIRSNNAGIANFAENSYRLNGIESYQYVLTFDSRLSDARMPLEGSNVYIQNNTTNTQSSASFNIGGNGTANKFNAMTEFQINGFSVIRNPGTNNLFVGIFSGPSNPMLSNGNSFFGKSTGVNITTGSTNSFFGISSGYTTSTGSNNSFFGASSGTFNTTGNGNAFFGSSSGLNNTTGSVNSFFGFNSGVSNTTSSSNSFFGASSGFSNTTGSFNSFFGLNSGRNNTTGRYNTFFGIESGSSITIGEYNSVFGSNTNLASNPNGDFNTLIGASIIVLSNTNNSSALGAGTTVTGNYATAIGAGSAAGPNSIVLGRDNRMDTVIVPGTLVVPNRATSGVNNLCIDSKGEITNCMSSIRYKSNINNFSSGLNLIKRLRPVSFNWRGDNSLDMGLVAEEVAEVEPLLVNRNKDGEVEGVKYDRIGVVLVNAVQEQQTQIEAQQKQIDEQKEIIQKQEERLEKQQKELDALKNLVCSQNPTAEFCKQKEERK